MHGGKALAGPAAPAFKHGRYSTALPTSIRARYEQAANDPDLLELGAEIALLEARIAQVLERLETEESSAAWQRLGMAWTKYESVKGDGLKEALALDDVGRLIEEGLADTYAWREVVDLVDARRRLVESDRRRLVELQQHMTYEQAMTLVAYIADSVKRHVTDPQQLAAISRDLVLAINRGARGSTHAGELVADVDAAGRPTESGL